MSEIEKLYENAGVEKEFEKPAECVKNPYITCEGCMLYDDKKGRCNNRKDYPPFTAEKQLELIKWLILNDFVDELDMTYRPFELMWVFKIYNVTEFVNEKSVCRIGADMTFEKGLASLINNLWQDLTDAEKAQIRDILAR